MSGEAAMPTPGGLGTADTCSPALGEREAELTVGSRPAHTPSPWRMCLCPEDRMCLHTCACLHL